MSIEKSMNTSQFKNAAQLNKLKSLSDQAQECFEFYENYKKDLEAMQVYDEEEHLKLKGVYLALKYQYIQLLKENFNGNGTQG
jgi:hypothetical protein